MEDYQAWKRQENMTLYDKKQPLANNPELTQTSELDKDTKSHPNFFRCSES